jgi:Membrane protein involved in the export of O-antigen and teichoic acid
VRQVLLPNRTNSAWIAIGTIGAAAISFLFQGILSVVLTDADFGLMTSSLILGLSFSVLLSMGAQDVTLHLVKVEKLNPRKVLACYRKAWVLHSIVPVTTSAAGFMVFGNAASAFFFISTFSALISLFVIHTAARQSRDDFFGVGSLLMAVEALKLAAVGFTAAVFRPNLDNLYLICGCIFCTIVVAKGIWACSHWRNECPNRLRYGDILSLGLPYAIAGLLFMAYYRVSIVVLSSLGMQDEAGSLSVIYLFLGAILLLPTSYSQKFLQGRWHSIAAADGVGCGVEMRRQYRLIMIFVAPFALAWYLFAEQMLGLLYPDRYQLAAEHARWFALVLVLRCICIPLQGASSVAGLRWKKMVAVLVAAFATFSASLVLAPVIGFLSGLAAALVAETIFASVLAYNVWRWRCVKP